ncbi:MAG: DUF4112 domain-containing protein [Bacteroidota bacterium]
MMKDGSQERVPRPELLVLEGITSLMDNKFRLPFTQFRFGLDPIIGLVPLAGNIMGFLISGLIIISMVRYGTSFKLLLLMLGNIILDFLVGLIPVLGIIFDVGYKANRRNYHLLDEHYEEGKHGGSGWGIIFIIVILLGLVLAGLIYLTQQLFELLKYILI